MTKKIVEDWWRVARQRNVKRYEKQYKGLKFKFRKEVLDIGGGVGTFLKYNGIEEATIVDVGGKESLVGNYEFIEADVSKKLPDLGKKFNTIFLMEILEHLKNPLYLMSQVYDLLTDKGVCYISVPYTKLYPKWKDKNPYNIHYSRWTLKEITNQMQKLGFKVKVLQKRRRFKNTAFYLPYCWMILELRKWEF